MPDDNPVGEFIYGRCLVSDSPARLYDDDSMSCWWEAIVESSCEHEPRLHFAPWDISERQPVGAGPSAWEDLHNG
jgi:hypothetical protein